MTAIRKLPRRALPAYGEPAGQSLFAAAPPPPAAAPRIPSQPMRAVQPLAEDTLKVQFTASRKPNTAPASGAGSRSIPAAIRRAVYQRDGGRCTFTDDRGRRCGSLDGVEYDHVEGFARTRAHSVEGLRLLCRAHNQLAAEQLYGQAFMARARSPQPTATPAVAQPATCPGTAPASAFPSRELQRAAYESRGAARGLLARPYFARGSGPQAGSVPPSFSLVTCRCPEPSSDIIQICFFAPREDEKSR